MKINADGNFYGSYLAAFKTLWLKCTHHVCLTHQPTNPVDFIPLFLSLNCSWENPSSDAPDYTWRKALVSIGTDPSSVSAHSPVNPHVTPSSSPSSLLLPLCAFMQPPVELLRFNSALSGQTYGGAPLLKVRWLSLLSSITDLTGLR